MANTTKSNKNTTKKASSTTKVVEKKETKVQEHISKYVKNLLDNIGFDCSKEQIDQMNKESATKFYELKKDCSEKLSLAYKVVLKIFYYCHTLEQKYSTQELREYFEYKVKQAKNSKTKKAQLQKEALCVAYYVSKKVGLYIA